MLVAVTSAILPLRRHLLHHHHHHRHSPDTLLFSRENSESSFHHGEHLHSQDDDTPHQVRMVPCPASATTTSRDAGVHFDVIEREVNPGIPLEIGRFTDNLFIPHRISFRSKVVSRKHAVLWLERGKLYIRDTKSSSGTFVNNIRLSPSNKESKPYQLRDGDTIQFGTDFRGGAQDSCRCIRLRLELDRKITHEVDWFSFQSYQSLRQLTRTPPSPVALDDASVSTSDENLVVTTTTITSRSSSSSSSSTPTTPAAIAADEHSAAETLMKDCCICLYAVAPMQALFVAPCQHTFHYKCIRPLLKHYPGFQCPVCRGYADLETSVAIESHEVLEMLSKLKQSR